MEFTRKAASKQVGADIISFPHTYRKFDRRAAGAVAQLCQDDTDIGDLCQYGPYRDGIARLVQAVRDYQRAWP